MGNCSIIDCPRPRKARGWCSTHYERWRVHGDPMHETWTKVCAVEGCEKPHKSAGYCSMHWERWRRHGDAGAPEAVRVLRYELGTTCAVDECDGDVKARGWCVMHYARWQDHGDPLIVLAPKAERVPDCVVCGKPTIDGHRQFCSIACRAFLTRSSRFGACKLCGDVLTVGAGPSGMRLRGNGRGLCLSCAVNAPCVHCGKPQHRGASGKMICRECVRPRKVLDSALRRARKVDALCEHGERCVTTKVIKAIRDGDCYYCGAPAQHADHFEPLARGGLHCVDNLVPACSPCNLSKGDRDPWSWWARREVSA